MINTKAAINADIKAINSIDIVPSLLEVVCRTTGMGFAAIARVTDDSWVACSVRDEISFGLRVGNELKLETTICNEIRQSHRAVMIDHVAKDEEFKNHHTPAMYGFQSYISMPIFRKDGSFFGTLCAIDPKPAILKNTEKIGMFRLFADLIAFHLNAIEKSILAEKELLKEQRIGQLRDEFIAILGHDLRNPLNAVMAGSDFLSRIPLEDDIKKVVHSIKNSSFRMAALIDNVLDFARGKLGDGIILNNQVNNTLQKVLDQVIDELLVCYPKAIIIRQFTLIEPVYCDSNRIAQLFSNLLGNAITHGNIGKPIIVDADSSGVVFKLSITNQGESIDEDKQERLFQPFYRGNVKNVQQGLGLGLYIASEIAKAHHGTLTVKSNDEQTVFKLEMPLQ